MDVSLLGQFGEALKKYKTSKGTIQFPPDRPLPKALVTKIVRARVAHNEAKGGISKAACPVPLRLV
jgi:uncharacterized protein YdhG (YjbR/CyaY superfamily)